ncbi:hypothetical protein HY641_03345 [Candidatus Woesearchaeota archaeon]|nr:hypothetical protein [Candidatus Woesearchaeota archaeon]
MREGLLAKAPSHSRFVPFYLNNARMSFLVAQHLHSLSVDDSIKKNSGFPAEFECFLWVVVTAYYGMFYAANAALAKLGLKVGEKIAHKVVQDCLLVYFIKNTRIAKSLLDAYKDAKGEVLAMMRLSEEELLKEFQVKAHDLVATFSYQRKSRGEFQYDITTKAKENVARLSLERSSAFIRELSSVIDKIK